MLTIEPTGAVLGATVRGVDLAQSLDERDMGRILLALGRHGVLRFPDQHLDLASPNAAGGLNGDAVQFSRTKFSTFGPVENVGISQSYGGAHNLLLTERYVTVTATATMALPNSPVDGQTYSIKSQVNVGAPVTTTVDALGGILIDGTATATGGPGQSRTFSYSASEGQWEAR